MSNVNGPMGNRIIKYGNSMYFFISNDQDNTCPRDDRERLTMIMGKIFTTILIGLWQCVVASLTLFIYCNVFM